MVSLLVFFAYFYLNTIVPEIVAADTIPPVRIEVSSPQEFKVSIPDEDGIITLLVKQNVDKEIKEGIVTPKQVNGVLEPRRRESISEDEVALIDTSDQVDFWENLIRNGFFKQKNINNYDPDSFSTFSKKMKNNITKLPSVGTRMEPDSKNCLPSITTMNGVPVQCESELIFEDEFDADHLNLSKWRQEVRFSTGPDYEFVVYLSDENTFNIANGILNLKLKPLTSVYGADILNKALDLGANCTGNIATAACVRTETSFDILPPLISAQFKSLGRFHFKYGKVEIRAKLPNIDWVFPQFFLDPVDNYYGTENYNSGQMRIAFLRGDKPCELSGGVILFPEEPIRKQTLCSTYCDTEDWSEDFHIYTLTWTPDGIYIAVDKMLHCPIVPEIGGFSDIYSKDERVQVAHKWEKSGTKIAPFDREFYLTIGYGVGGHNDFSDDDYLNMKKPWTNNDPRAMKKFWKQVRQNSLWQKDESKIQIDYIRVYSI